MTAIPSRRDNLRRASAFGYRCNACGRCCVGKRIQVNPYEIARLSDGLGISTAKFIDRYLEDDGPYLRQTESNACVFFGPSGCSVHANRPLVCRLYPLGRVVDPDGREKFRELEPDPETAGDYLNDSLVQNYLDDQDAGPFVAAADAYHELVDELLSQSTETGSCGTGAIDRFDSMWLDLDSTAPQTAGPGGKSPAEERMRAHIERIRSLLQTRTGR